MKFKAPASSGAFCFMAASNVHFGSFATERVDVSADQCPLLLQ